ncbi:MAG: helix-hairpin-helix domain-containing protein [Eubacterium sp.]|nr:helix-hairpin-helix domain-containing protein [Eubacterium sp.]
MKQRDTKDFSRYIAALGIILIGVIVCIFAVKAPMVYDNAKSSEAADTATETSSTTEEISVEYPLNLNTASVEELMTIDGIGESIAASIVSYREDYKKFDSVEEIKNIQGIGDGIYQRVAPYLTV